MNEAHLRTWVPLMYALDKMVRDIAESKRHAVGIGAPRSTLLKLGAPRKTQ